MPNPMIPSPMTEERLRLFQKRAEAQQSIARRSDRDGATGRHASTSLAGTHTHARSVGSRIRTSRESKYDEDGEELEVSSDFTALDRYLAIVANLKGPLTKEGWQALREAIKERSQSCTN